MSDYDLQPGESFVHRNARVRHGGAAARPTDELILTSQNLVLIKKSVFGNNKGVRVFPLSQIRIFQGHAQAVVGKQNGWPTLDVYFQNGTEQFGFETLTKGEATFWCQKIDELITGTPAKMISPNSSAADMAAAAMKDTVGAVKDAFGFKTKAELAAAAAAVPVAASCISCGAPVSGTRGQAVVCSYCDSPNQL